MESQLDILKRIIPEYKRLFQSGQIEISYSPYYHPIMPLLIDSETSREAIPDVELPYNRFIFPEDAEWHLTEAIEHCRKLFGAEPSGIWPSEGSISEDTIRLLSRKGVRWTASDQEILYYSLVKSSQNPHDYSTHSAYVYRDAPETAVFFRDHGLSDKIGFVYSSWDHNRAVNDFIVNLKSIAAGYGERIGDYVIPIILDGENAWEYYRNDGTEFLRSLYRALSEDKDIETVTFSEAVSRLKPISMPKLFSGSWINHNFRIWIGHEEDNAAWDYLYKARKSLTEYQKKFPGADKEKIKQAWEQIYIAEGSDWCWWYGNDHLGDYNHQFDLLFRRHLGLVYELIGEKSPPELSQPIHAGKEMSVLICPEGLVTPEIDGRLTQYYEWSGAGTYDCSRANKMMHRANNLINII